MWIKNEYEAGCYDLINLDRCEAIKVCFHNESYEVRTILNDGYFVLHEYKDKYIANELVAYIFDCITHGLKTIVLTMEMKDAA